MSNPQFRPFVVRDASRDGAPDVQAQTVEPNEGDTIHIDGDTGRVVREQDDGSLVVEDSQPRERDPGDFDENLADDPDLDVATLASRLCEQIESDLRSRNEWEETTAKAAELVGTKLEAMATSGNEGTFTKVWNTLLIEAATQSWANAQAELLPAAGPVKVRDDEPVQSGAMQQPQQPGQMPPKRDELAEALEKDMNHYLTAVDRDYYPDFSKMLMSRGLKGMAFRKVYRDPLIRRPISRWVKAEDLIIHNNSNHLSGAARVTERIKMRQATVRRMMQAGVWLDIELGTPTPAPSISERAEGEAQGIAITNDRPEDYEHTIYECYTDLDDGPLQHDEKGKDIGYPLPYRVTIDKDARKVLEVRRNWKEGDENHQRRRRYVKYGFVPSLGFYDWGLVHLIGNPQRACTMIERLLIDAGVYSNFPGGLIAKGPGSRQDDTSIMVGPGQFKNINTAPGMTIQQTAMALPYKDPSPVVAGIAEKIADDARRVVGAINMPVGEGRVGDVPVQTIMAYIDSVTKVPSAVHKADHSAQSEEFELLKELFVEEPESLWKFVKTPSRQWKAQEIEDQELVPAADPNIPSQVHRVMQATALAQLAGLPQFQGVFNNRGIAQRITTVLGVRDDGIINPPVQPHAAPPDPRMLSMAAQAAAKQAQVQATIAKTQQEGQIAAARIASEQAEGQANRDSEERRMAMELEGDQIKESGRAATHSAELSQDDRHHAIDTASEHVLAATPAPPNPNQQTNEEPQA